jgi:hypothetical protein
MIKNWYEKDSKVHQDIFEIVRSIQNNQSLIRRNIQRNIRLYGSVMTANFSNASYVQMDDFSDKMNINIAASLVDTVYNKITKNKPRVQFLTEAGNWENQQTAEKLNKFVDGQFYSTKIYEQMPIAFRDAEIMGPGFVKIVREKDKIKAERVFSGEIVVDELEGIYGTTKTMYQVKLIPRELLKGMFPEHKFMIDATKTLTYTSGASKISESLWVIEAWRLPTNELKNNGKHAICIENCDLLLEDYKKDYFPFVKIDWKKKLLGYAGSSLIDDIYPIQMEITRVCRKIQQIFHLLGVPRVYLEYASEVIKTQLTNEIGSVVYYNGQPPIIAPPSVLDPSLFSYLQWLIQTAYENVGVSQLSAQSKKPSGLDSGKALREFNDIESERFFKAGESYETAFIDAAHIMIDYAQDIAKEFGDYSVMAKTNEAFELIKWSEIDLEKDQYVMQAYPTSFFSKTPAGQMQDAVEMIQAGMIDRKEALRIFDFPDVKAVTKYVNAPQELIHKIFDWMVFKNEYISPEPFMDLDYGMKYGQTYYNQAKMENVPEARLEFIRTWLSVAKDMIDQAIQAEQAKQMQAQAQQQMMMALQGQPNAVVQG